MILFKPIYESSVEVTEVKNNGILGDYHDESYGWYSNKLIRKIKRDDIWNELSSMKRSVKLQIAISRL